MKDLEDKARIKTYMEAKMKHIKMYNECMNLADGLDVEKFAELVRQDERELCAKVCEAMADKRFRQAALRIRTRGEKPLVKSYAGGKPNYCTPDVDAVPEFTVTEPRQSLSKMKPGDRFVLVRTGEICRIKNDGSQWNETAQRPSRFHKNSQVRLIVDAVNMKQERVDEAVKSKREWVGLTKRDLNGYSPELKTILEYIEAILKRKNT